MPFLGVFLFQQVLDKCDDGDDDDDDDDDDDYYYYYDDDDDICVYIYANPPSTPVFLQVQIDQMTAFSCHSKKTLAYVLRRMHQMTADDTLTVAC